MFGTAITGSIALEQYFFLSESTGISTAASSGDRVHRTRFISIMGALLLKSITTGVSRNEWMAPMEDTTCLAPWIHDVVQFTIRVEQERQRKHAF